jgi:hypothetical protein
MNFNLKYFYKFNIVFLLYTFTNCVDANSQVVPHGLMHNKAYTENSIFADAQFNLDYRNDRPNPSIKSDFSFNFSNNTPYTFQFQYSVFDDGISNNHEFEIPLIGFTNESSLDTATAIILYSFKSYFTIRTTAGLTYWTKHDKIVPYVLNSNKDFSKNVIGTTSPFNSFSSGVITTVYNGQSWKNYKNGILVNEIINTTIWNGSGNLIIGYGGNRNPEHNLLNLFYDEIRFWNRALSPDEITNNWNKPLKGDETGLQVYYNFNHQGYPSYMRWNNIVYGEPTFDFYNKNVKYLNDLSPNKFKGTFLNCELQGFINNFYRMTSDTYKNNFDSLIFHFDANNVDSYPGTGFNNNSPSNGKLYNLNGFSNNLQFYNNSNYNNITSLLFYKDGGRSFGGRNIFGKSNYNSDITGASPLTIEAWVKFNSLNNTSFISLGENLDGKQFELALLNSRIFFNPGGIYNDILFSQIIDINKWYYVVCTYNGRSNYIIYINGVTDQSKQFNNPNWVTQNTTNTPIYIGKNQSSFNGKIGFLKIYNRSLNFLEVSKRYDASKSRFGY